jgi:subtilisin family serine protease
MIRTLVSSKSTWVLFTVISSFVGSLAGAVEIDVDVRKALNSKADEGAKLPIVLHLKERYDLDKLPTKFENQAERGRAIAEILENYNKESIGRAFPFLATDKRVEEITPIWLTNSVRIKADPELVKELSTWDDKLESITLDIPREISEIADDVGGATLHQPNLTLDNKIGWGVEKLRAPEVWQRGTAGTGILAAVIDSGAAVEHPDLAPNIWKNSGETGIDERGQNKESNGVDDDKNGYVDDLNGWNFENNSKDLKDKNGHGSQTAGLVGGMGAGGTQTGVAPKVKLMIVRACCDLGGKTGEVAIMKGMEYAIKNGANLISMSLSIKWFSNPTYAKWRQASELVLKAGVVHINSAGNLGSGKEPKNIGAPASNPPAWFHPEQVKGDKPTSMITIGATDEKDKVRSYSSVGPVTWEDIEEYKDFPYEKGAKKGLIKPEVCGPSEVPSTSMDGKSYTTSFGGTSSATPQVAGVVALLLSANPKLTVAQVTEALQMSAILIDGSYNNKCGAGRVDAVAALDYVLKHFRN